MQGEESKEPRKTTAVGSFEFSGYDKEVCKGCLRGRDEVFNYEERIVLSSIHQINECIGIQNPEDFTGTQLTSHLGLAF